MAFKKDVAALCFVIKKETRFSMEEERKEKERGSLREDELEYRPISSF